MAPRSTDRQRMHNDLRELARLAKPGSDSPVQGFDTADSSGYVDLSAYSTNDPHWVDRELARARKGAPPLPPPPRAGGKAIDALLPASMAPVSLEVPGDPDDTMNARPSRARGAVYTGMGLAAVAAVGFLAFTLARHPPPPAAATVDPAAATVAAATTAAPATNPATTTAATTPSAAAPMAAAETATTKARKKTFATPRAHPVTPASEAAPAAAPAHAAAAAVPAAVIPKSKPGAGGDSLMELIKKSVATGK